MILLDTNIFVDYLRGYDEAVNFFNVITRKKEEIIFSAITEAELVAGKECANQEKKDKLLNFLANWSKIEVSNQIACKAGDLSRNYGMLIPDAIIAATAITNKADIITRNIKDFNKIPNIQSRVPY